MKNIAVGDLYASTPVRIHGGGLPTTYPVNYWLAGQGLKE
jgi:hypothetical protein